MKEVNTETRACAFCKILNGRTQKASVDGALTLDGRSLAGGYAWAYMCKTHHARYGVGLGVGKGQLLTDD